MKFADLKSGYQQSIAGTYSRFDLDVEQGQGASCQNAEGKEYIDFSSGIGVNSLGFCDEGWVKAIEAQLHTLNHTSNLYYTQPQLELAKALCEKSGMQRVFYANSGAEANEGVIKTCRKYSSDKYGPGRYEIICLHNSFHGRTITTLSATGQEVFHQHFHPFTPGFVFAEANNLADLTAKVTEKTCAIFVECVQGEGGVIPLTEEFIAGIAKLCAEKDLVLAVDEVQTGLGRTGAFFCYQHFGLQPDVVSTAKGLGGGLPIGAVLFGEKTKNTLGPGDHATTFGGNPIVCAGANYVVEQLTPAFLAEVTVKGAAITEKLLAMKHVKSVTGKGLMLGVELDGPASVDVVKACGEKGLILLTAKHKLRLLPPLNISSDQLDKGLAILSQVLEGIA
ncbi:aspartate aminotransferase family protein [Oscillospiraceae bacterium MB08-C2-2]|nr:aspartate aminotransferase family protein [Oscillospiraceae bacterium MB08-C2-2]